MNARTRFRASTFRFASFCCIAALSALVSLPEAAAEVSFVDADSDFASTVDSATDSDGITYVVGTLGSRTGAAALPNGWLDSSESYLINSGASRDTTSSSIDVTPSATVIKKYDKAGVLQSWDAEKPNLTHLVIRGIDEPSKIHLAANGFIYLIGKEGGTPKILKLDQATGLRLARNTSFAGTVELKDIAYSGKNDRVYITGFYDPSDSTVRVGDDSRDDYDQSNMGSRAAFLVRMSADLVVNHHSYFGANGGWTMSNSVVTDETGAVYIAGRYGSGTTVNGFLEPDDAYGSGQGFVMKYSSEHAGVAEYHASPSGGSLLNLMVFRELHYSQGWLYAIGDQGSDDTGDIAIVKLDTELQEKAYAEVTSAANLRGRSVTSDEAGNVYLTGRYGPGSIDLIDPEDADNETEFTTSTPERATFVAKLKPDFVYEWVRTPDEEHPTSFGAHPTVRWNRKLQRLVWSGDYSGGSLTMGEPHSPVTAAGPAGFVSLLEPEGTFTQRVKLSIFSEYGKSATQLKPFGNPVDANPPDPESEDAGEISVGEATNTKLIIKGTEITASAPRFLYRNILGNDLTDDLADDEDQRAQEIDQFAETRIVSTGFSINDIVQEGDAANHTFILDRDTQISFNWQVEYALRIRNSDESFDGTLSRETVGDPTLRPYVSRLTSEASGNPEPSANKHWIPKDEPVEIGIDGNLVDIFTDPGLNIRTIVRGYKAYGSANPNTDDAGEDFAIFSQIPISDGAQPDVANLGELRDFESLNYNERRLQVPEEGEGFTMYGPGGVTFIWGLQYGVQVNTASLETTSLPRIEVVHDPRGTLPGLEGHLPEQVAVDGSGVHWFDDGTRLRIGTREYDDLDNRVEGWINGDGNRFAATGTTADLTTTFTADSKTYLGRELELRRPARMMWTYGEEIFIENVFIGEGVVFNTEPPFPVDRFAQQEARETQPEIVEFNNAPDGTTIGDMAIWDDNGKRLYPLRPGDILLKWNTDVTDPTKFVKIRVFIQYKPEPHFPHIAGTPPVSLDPDPEDEMVFREVRYSENDAQVDDSENFTAVTPGRSVLQFGRLSRTGRGEPKEFVEIRVVETKRWDDVGALAPEEEAIIGAKISSPYDQGNDPDRNPDLNPASPPANGYDRAGLGTGYVFFGNARFNPFIYDRDKFSGRKLLDRDDPPGPVIAVNLHPGAQAEERLVVVWYDDPEVNDKMLWPHRSVVYNPRWPRFPTDPEATEGDDLQRIVIASRHGNENVDADGNDQVVAAAATINGEVAPEETTYNPTRFQQLQIYNQPDRSSPGYNPNEEHALIAPSLRFADVSPRPFAAYALRDNDLNNTTQGDNYTSDPYVLTQYFDAVEGEFKMRVYQVFRDDAPRYTFDQTMFAGEPVIPFYPLPIPIGATPCSETFGVDGAPDQQMVYWEDHKGTSWAVSGTTTGNPQAHFYGYFYYPLTPDFWWPLEEGRMVGDCVAFLPEDRLATGFESFPTTPQPIEVPKGEVPQAIRYDVEWPKNLPILKVGETLTFAGGEYRFDNPTRQIDEDGDGELETVETPGLPGVLAWSAGEVVYDDLNPIMDDQLAFSNYTARLFQALEERFVVLPIDSFPAELLPANGRTAVKGVNYAFTELSASLQKRVLYNPLNGRLALKGFLNDKDIGDPTLTAPPPPLYVLELNVLTPTERDELLSLSDNPSWTAAVDDLYNKARNPEGLDQNGNGIDQTYRVGLEPKILRDDRGAPLTTVDAFGIESLQRDITKAAQLQALGVGLAVTANPDFLDPLADTPPVSYVTLAENNHPSLGGSPVTLHIIQVDRRQRYRGAIKTVLSDNVFDENIILRHSGDFGGNADKLVFEWWYRAEDGIPARPPDEEMNIPGPNPWLLFADPSGNQGQDFFQVKLKGNPNAPEALIADTLWYVRYRHLNDLVDGVDWELNQPRGESKVNFQWAGAANSTPQDQDGDGLPDYRPQLALGWVKRVLDAVNPYEARIRDFEGDSPATYTSMIRQFGPRFEGPVALNPDKNVIENVGLIELYSTVLERAMDLSINLSTPISTRAITNALQLASTRISDFYVILGNEAYTDALDPTIGFGSSSVEYGSLAPAVHAFQNQLSSPVEEELALLRGMDDFKGRPVYNRLFWNFTKGEGEAAYAQNYNIFDVNEDGFVDETDGLILYPQGHGDAWGHYLTAVRAQYELLRHPFFNWVSRSELYNLLDVVFDVDFLDERKFARAAAAKAKAGAEIVNLTYRAKYVESPEGQWQGYKDIDELRGWGVEEWSRRAGQGAYFDWVTANALLPAEHPNQTLEGLQKVDRTTNPDIAVISANLSNVQKTFDEANNGFNPLGLAGNVVPFDVDPESLDGSAATSGVTHFEQVYARAVKALENAVAVFDNANQTRNMLRKIGNTEEEFQRSVFKEDLAFRNKLIQIFGRPYDGTIGTGQAYPPGYLGPDTMLYMYLDVLGITEDTVPQPTEAFMGNFDSAINDNIILGSFLSVPDGYRELHAESFYGSDPAAFRNNFSGVNYTGPGGFPDENGNVDGDGNRVPIPNMNLPITTQGYAFQAPPSWGQRSAPGRLQLHLNKMLQKEAELARAIANWDGFQGGLVREVRKVVATDNLQEELLALELSKTIADGILNGIITGFAITSAGAEFVVDTAEDVDEGVEDFSPDDLPTAGLSFSPGSVPGDIVDGGAQIGTSIAKGIARGLQLSADVSKLNTELFKGIADDLFDFGVNQVGRNKEIRDVLTDLENMAGDEGILRVEIFRQQEALRELSDQYRSILYEGVRLLEEREAFNKHAAAITQRQRYQDMTFRVSRNESLQNYRDAFDLAAQYAYLAAKAYDYETNLDPSDAASAQAILTDIVRQRGLGHFANGQPRLGKGGLAEALAWMKVNYDGLKGQLGFNNPQTETGRFSLRQERFRIPKDEGDPGNDAAWKAELMDAIHPNLWELPEFRLHCRPFAAYDPGTPEPGLVIDFTSEVNAGKNFFGRPLGGGDHAYDPTNFATKIRSVGAWFEGYLSSDFNNGLSETPRVYLVPVGTDVMSIPTDGALTTRSWDVLDQRIPRPLPARSADLDDPEWRPANSLDGLMGERRRFSSFRAYHDSGFFSEDEMSYDSRLIGRSVWNTRWLLIIPGRTLLNDPDQGLETFINTVTDIKIFFQTYGFSGG